MSQGEALLNSLTDEQLAAYSVNPDDEPHVIVGIDRFITVPESLKRVAVQYDHDVETVIFDCPRYWDGLDMSTMAVYINYMRSDKYTDSYPVSDIYVAGDIMHFSWTISRNVTEVPGQISFLICIKKTDTDGNESNHWNSELCQDMYVSAGMETDEQPMDLYPDIVTELLLRMTNVENVAVTYDEMVAAKNRAEAAAIDAEATKKNIDDSAAEIRNSYANAVKKAKSGEIITANDVSPVDHDVKVKVHGKNLANVDDVVIENYTGYHKPIPLGAQVVAGITYTLSMDISSSVEPFIVSIGYGDKTSYLIDGTYSRNLYNGRVEISFTPTEDLLTQGSYIHVRCPRYATETTYSATVSNIQLELGSVATEYEPYIDPTTVTITGCGKNMFPYPYDATVYANGITFKNNGDGSVTLNGVNDGSANSVFYLTKDLYITIPAGTYSCSPNVSGVSVMGVEQGGGYFTFCSVNKTSFILSEPKTFRSIYIQILKGTADVFNNLTIRPMLEYGDVQSSFELYSGSTATPDSDGVCTVKSVSPNMTIFANTPGVIVEAEYNQDQHKVLGDISAALDHIIEIQNSILGES